MKNVGSVTGTARRGGMRALALAALGFGALAAAPRDARADSYKDEKLGFSLNFPSKWKQMPISTDERWMVAEWQCAREFEFNDTKTNSWTRHSPKLDVVIIPNSAAKQKGAEIQEDKDKIIIKQAAPWTDLKEYLDKTTQDMRMGGYYFSKEEETKVGDMKVIVYEITMDKFTTTWNSAPRKIYGWAFYASDAIYGIVGDALVKYEDKVKPDLDAAFRSFKIFTRTGTLPGEAVTPGEGGDVVVKKDPKKEHLTDEDLKKARVEEFNRQLARIKSTLTEGWKVKESDNFAAVTHCNDKFTGEVLDHAEALRAWLEQTLGYVGSGYAGKIIIRVCADDNERSAMWNTMGYSYEKVEIITCQDKSGWSENKMSDLNWGVYGIWMRDKNRDLYYRIPSWIDDGLRTVISSAVNKGRKITDFKASVWDKEQIAILRRADKLLPAKNFFAMDSEKLWNDRENYRQAEFFVRFLLVGAAQRSAKYKNILGDYLKNMAMLIDEQKDAKKEDSKAPANEEEERAYQRAMQDAWKQHEQDTLKTLMEKTFPSWDDKAWDSFNSLYWKELGA